MGDLILNILNSPAFQTLASTFLASVAVNSTIAGIKQVKDAIESKPHEAQLLDSLEQAFFITEQELGIKHNIEAIYETFLGSPISFSSEFSREALSGILDNALGFKVTDEQVEIWIDNLLKQLTLDEHNELRRYLMLRQVLKSKIKKTEARIKTQTIEIKTQTIEKYILTPLVSVYENPDIIGRDELVETLLQLLEIGHNRIQLAGLGGIGKTETLSKLYARLATNRGASSFDHIAFIRFSGGILSDIEAQVNYPPEYLGLQGAEAAKKYLQDICQEKKVLLCLDDIRNKQPLLDEHDPNIEFLHSLGASILLAARAGFPGFEVHDLEFLSIDECIQVFERQYGRSITDNKDLEILKRIINNRAGNHTMVVNRLGSMAKIYSWSIPVLSKKLEEKNFSFAINMSDDELLLREINKFYQINDSFNDAEKNLLEAFSIFPASPLSADLCVEWLHEDAGVDEDNCARLFNKLAEQTWLEKRCGSESGVVSFLMHQLVRSAVQGQVELQYFTHHKLVENCTDSLVAYTEKYDLMKASLIIPFAISIFENLFQENQSSVVLALNIGQYFVTAANYVSALEWFARSLAISEKVLGKSHPDTVAILSKIASVYMNQGKYDMALELYMDELVQKKEIYGGNHPSVINTYRDIARIFYFRENFLIAQEWYMRALSISENLLGQNNLDTARIYEDIAAVYQKKGEFSLALLWYQKALVTLEKILGKDHPNTALHYDNIASVFYDRCEYDIALEWYQKALNIRERVLGEDHPDTALTYVNIALVYRDQGKYDLALELFKKALVIFEARLGSEHPHTIQVRKSIKELESMLNSNN